MSPEENDIYDRLVDTPEEFYVTNDGTRMYVLLSHTGMLMIPGSDLHKMTDAEQREFLQNAINR